MYKVILEYETNTFDDAESLGNKINELIEEHVGGYSDNYDLIITQDLKK